MTGTIEKRSQHQTSDGTEYLRLKIDGIFYTLWASSLFDVAQEGVEVDLVFTEKPGGNGQVFRNINSLSAITKPPAPNPQPAPANANSKDVQIARQSSLKTSMDFHRLQAGGHTPTVTEVIDIADHFVRYVMNGK